MRTQRDETETGADRRAVCLIFNPESGSGRQSPVQLLDVLGEMQKRGFEPEPHLIGPGFDLSRTVERALAAGVRLFAVCGGDGTVSPAARLLAGRGATLGVIPTGTQNNIARSLRVPLSIPDAVQTLDEGRRVRADLGVAVCGKRRMPFLEVCTVGLFSALFPAGDELQHGRLSRLGDFLATLVMSPPASLRLKLEDGAEVAGTGHMLLVSNMPCVLRHNRVGTPACYRDGFLDVLLFGGLSKLGVAGVTLRGGPQPLHADPRLQKMRARRLSVETDPPMQVMADGIILGSTPLRLEVWPRALTLIAARGQGRPSALGEEDADGGD